jgi:ribosomal protein S18 acetylase RimI-like enzyme
MNTQIHQLESRDIDRVINIHKSSLPNDLLPNLGLWVMRQYYQRAIGDGNHYLTGCSIDNDLVGFCLVEQKPIKKPSAVFLISLFCGSILLLFTNPKLLISGITQTLKRIQTSDEIAEISFIAVSPKNQGSGIGTDLVHDALIAHNQLITKTSNNRLKNFYVRQYCGTIIKTFSVFDKTYSYLLLRSTASQE